MENHKSASVQNQSLAERSSKEVAIARLGPWFQNLHLPGGVQTAPNHSLGDYPTFKWEAIKLHLPDDLTGWRVLDIGCNAGFYSFKLAERGAQVLGVDREPFYLRQAEWAREVIGLGDRVRFEQMQIYDLTRRKETFDLVIFMGVFYHLRYPLLGLDIAVEKVADLMLFQSLTMPGTSASENTSGLRIDDRAQLLDPAWPKMAFFENDFAGDRTNWWAPNHACVEAMLRSSGMKVIARPAEEIYLCRKDREHPGCFETWNAEEFLAATERG